MKTVLRTPSHVCPHCGEWWTVEPIGPNLWMVFRYGDRTRAFNELVFAVKCPDCKRVVLNHWLIEEE